MKFLWLKKSFTLLNVIIICRAIKLSPMFRNKYIKQFELGNKTLLKKIHFRGPHKQNNKLQE